jgi:hypothetical protein
MKIQEHVYGKMRYLQKGRKLAAQGKTQGVWNSKTLL